MKTLLSIIPPSELLSLAFTVLCFVGTLVMSELRKRLKNQASIALLDKLDKLATVVVLEIEQTIVKPAKLASDTGRLNAEMANQVKAQAVRRLLQMAGDKNSDLRKAFGDVTATAEMVIEAKVRELRMAQTGRNVR